MPNVAAFLYFRSELNKYKHTEKFMLLNRMCLFLDYKLKTTPWCNNELAHKLRTHLYYPSLNDEWWDRMRIYKNSSLFAELIKQYL